MKYLIVFALLFTAVAHAQVMGREAFAALSDQDKVDFLSNQADEKPLTARQRSSALVKRLQAAALQEANVWGDTVLEGPYAQTGDVQISDAVAFVVNNQVYAYRFTISADAIYTEADGCEYNDETEEWSEVCFETAGTISEEVSFTFAGTEFDEGSYADYND